MVFVHQRNPTATFVDQNALCDRPRCWPSCWYGAGCDHSRRRSCSLPGRNEYPTHDQRFSLPIRSFFHSETTAHEVHTPHKIVRRQLNQMDQDVKGKKDVKSDVVLPPGDHHHNHDHSVDASKTSHAAHPDSRHSAIGRSSKRAASSPRSISRRRHSGPWIRLHAGR